MRPFVSFDADAPAERVAEGRAARLRADSTLLWLALVPGFAFVRQRSNFILGWQAAAAAGAAVRGGEASGAVGAAGVPALGSWMMLPDLTTPATATVLPMNDALYGACPSSWADRARWSCESRRTPTAATTRWRSSTRTSRTRRTWARSGPAAT